MEQKTAEIIWRTINPLFTKEEFGDGWENLRPKIIVPLFHLRESLPDGYKIIINCAYEDRPGGHGKGLAIDFRIVAARETSFSACVGLVESFLRQHDLENFMALGIYPEWGNGERPGFHLEAEEEERERPRRWGAKYKRDTDGELFLRDGMPVQEYIAYDASLKSIGGAYSV